MNTLKSILGRLAGRHTTVVAYVALFAALGGSAYAAATFTGSQIKDGTITGKDVKNRSLGPAKLDPAALSSLAGKQGPAGPAGPAGSKGDQGPAGSAGAQGAAGPVGPRGPSGPKGDTGPTGNQGPKGDEGSPGISGMQLFRSDMKSIGPGLADYVEVQCPPDSGKRAISGGASAVSAGTKLIDSAPYEDLTGWAARYHNTTTSSQTVFAWVVCAYVSQ